MNISFIIVTNGLKDKECALQIRTIRNQSIPQYEIVIVGNVSLAIRSLLKSLDIPHTSIDMKEEADKGSLGAMRNAACKMAAYPYMVISDDDMLFTDKWYYNIKQNKPFDILTPRVKLPDGTRFWDHCCYMSPTKGHIILNPDENDDYLYMSGGQSWVMTKEVFEVVQWDEGLKIYNMSNMQDYQAGKHNEDTEYSLRCRQKFTIQHNPNILVYHNDSSYTSYGRVVRRRHNRAPFDWCKNISLPPQVMMDMGSLLLNAGLEAEGIDLFRKVYIDTSNNSVKNILNDIDEQLGGSLEGSIFSFNDNEYHKLT